MSAKSLCWTRPLVGLFWDEVSNSRLREISFSAMAANTCVQIFSPFLKRQNSYLDFGGGDGDLADALCSSGFRVATYDLSEARRQKAEKRLTKHGINFLGSIGPDTEMKFDGIFLIEVAEHILDEDLIITYEKIKSLLNPGGFLFLTTPNNEDLELGYAFEPQSSTFFHRWQHVRSLNKEKLISMLQPFGFHEILSHELDFRQDALDAMKECTTNAGIPDPFALMRPIIMGTRANLVAIFSTEPTRIVVQNEPYYVQIRMVAELCAG